MKKVMALILTLIILVSFTGCGYKETKEYNIISARVWEEKEETGTFTTKVNTTTYIEVIYKTDDNYEKINTIPDYIFIEPETKVVHKNGHLTPMVYMTAEYYSSLFD